MISALAVSLQAAEMRIWMSRKGGTLEAQLGGMQGDTVTLINKDSKEIKLKIEDLSLADRQHLVEFGGADESIITGGKPGLVEKDVRHRLLHVQDAGGKLAFPDMGTADGFELFETPHFLVGTAGKRPAAGDRRDRRAPVVRHGLPAHEFPPGLG